MAKALSTTKRVEFISKKKFAISALDKNVETFVIHVASLTSKILKHPAWEAQITLMVVKKATVLIKYLDYSNVFSEKSAAKLPKQTDINKYVIKLESGKQPLY